MEKDPFGRFHAMENQRQLNLVKNVNFQIHSAVEAQGVNLRVRHGFSITKLIGFESEKCPVLEVDTFGMKKKSQPNLPFLFHKPLKVLLQKRIREHIQRCSL